MKPGIVFVMLLLASHFGGAAAQAPQSDLRARTNIFAIYPALETQAKEYGDADVRRDFERLLEMTWPKYVARYGRENLLADFAAGHEDLKKFGAQVVSWAPTEATQVIEDGGELYAVVATTLKVKAGEQTSDTRVCLIGISEDRGEHWTFISASCINVKDEFPAIAGKLALCPEPVVVIKPR
ncbi:MAG TPA: hypothetical protein VE961_01145 [Pyrinomonadaceae bacterium]|nr:hypothetical protein [Pyrinomonadaceae bacterium]